MNIKMQVCGLIIVALLFVFIFSRKTLKLRRERTFILLLATTALTLVFDIASIFCICNVGTIYHDFVNIVCKLYIITLAWDGFVAYMYMLQDILKRKAFKSAVLFGSIGMAVVSVVSMFLPISYKYETRDVIYSEGLSTLVMYGLAVVISGLIVFSCIRFRKVVNPRKLLGMILWVVISFSAAFIQFIYKPLLIIGFGMAVGTLIIFILMENPEAQSDRTLGCFNSYALYLYMETILESPKDHIIMKIQFDEEEFAGKNESELTDLLRSCVRHLSKNRDLYVFKDNDVSLVVVSQDNEQINKLAEDAIQWLTENTTSKKCSVMVLYTPKDLKSSDELGAFFAFARNERIGEYGKVTTLDSGDVRRYYMNAEIEGRIRDALDEDRVEVFFQPIYSLNERSFVSAEALVRIREKDGTLWMPGSFIQVAEETGIILELGERVIEKVCQLFKESNINKLGIRYIEINLSVIQCENENLAKTIIEIVDRYEIDHSYINFEITETAAVVSEKTIISNMEYMVNQGFRFSLDDFGKGESNLMYLVDMPVSIVKMDMDLTKAYFKSDRAKEVVRTVVDMAHRLDLKVVSEGVEDLEELNALNMDEIDYIQGYYFSKPLPKKDFIVFLLQNKGHPHNEISKQVLEEIPLETRRMQMRRFAMRKFGSAKTI